MGDKTMNPLMAGLVFLNIATVLALLLLSLLTPVENTEQKITHA